jgi:hypothetical protein
MKILNIISQLAEKNDETEWREWGRKGVIEKCKK